MWVSQLDLTQWRNHHTTRLHLSPGISLFIGPNGQGKTNIVEAIRYMTSLSSHRVAGTSPLIRDDEAQATIFAQIHHGDRQVPLALTVKRQGSNEAMVGGSKAKVSDIPRWISSVLFSPEDAAIVRGEPGHRRDFMDDLVVSSSPSMVAVYQDFERVLRQRNSLLKSLRSLTKASDLSTLEAWTSKTVSLAAQIIVARINALRELIPFFIAEYGALAGGDVAGAQYDARGYVCEADQEVDSVAAALEEAFRRVRDEELDRGMTMVGPHRDDLQLTISGRPSRTHASQGETWSLALALRLAMAGWLRNKRSGGDPIIMLDDVFAELDSSRRAHLVASLAGYEQILITSAVEGDIPTTLQGEVFDVRRGVVTLR